MNEMVWISIKHSIPDQLNFVRDDTDVDYFLFIVRLLETQSMAHATFLNITRDSHRVIPCPCGHPNPTKWTER